MFKRKLSTNYDISIPRLLVYLSSLLWKIFPLYPYFTHPAQLSFLGVSWSKNNRNGFLTSFPNELNKLFYQTARVGSSSPLPSFSLITCYVIPNNYLSVSSKIAYNFKIDCKHKIIGIDYNVRIPSTFICFKSIIFRSNNFSSFFQFFFLEEKCNVADLQRSSNSLYFSVDTIIVPLSHGHISRRNYLFQWYVKTWWYSYLNCITTRAR